MKQFITFLICSFLVLTLSQQGASPQDAPQEIVNLPNFLGKSYNVLEGNLLSDRVDPGFRHDLFNFTYTIKETTEDGRYYVPDGVSHSLLSSCSFTTESEVYRGTKSYQQKIKQKAGLGGGYNGILTQAAFSVSQSYEKMHKDTVENLKSIVHATAECEAYKVEMNMFKIPALTSNFIQGVKDSYKAGNWTTFIQQFGTHFAYDVVLGGRASQETQYSFNSTQKIESLNIDIGFAAKAGFASTFMDKSFDFDKYKEQISYSSKISTTIIENYVGDIPPKNGNTKDWANGVYNNPMPVRVKLYDLGQLFVHILGIDLKKAKLSFYGGLDKYCGSHQCKNATNDLPKPPPAGNDLQASQEFGGTFVGTKFDYYVNSTTLTVKKFIYDQLKTSSYLYMATLQLLLSDEVKNIYTPKVGKLTGTIKTWQVPEGQFITQLQYYKTDILIGICLITNTGIKSPLFGSRTGTYGIINFPAGYRIVGFYGDAHTVVDHLGFHLAKTVYSPTPSNDAQESIKLNLLAEE